MIVKLPDLVVVGGWVVSVEARVVEVVEGAAVVEVWSGAVVEVAAVVVDPSPAGNEVVDPSGLIVVVGAVVAEAALGPPRGTSVGRRPLFCACRPATTLGTSSSKTNTVEAQTVAAVATPARRRSTSRRVICIFPSRRSVDNR
jgi:hypothetical protein